MDNDKSCLCWRQFLGQALYHTPVTHISNSSYAGLSSCLCSLGHPGCGGVTSPPVAKKALHELAPAELCTEPPGPWVPSCSVLQAHVTLPSSLSMPHWVQTVLGYPPRCVH